MTFRIREVSNQIIPDDGRISNDRVLVKQQSGRRSYAARYGSDRWLQGGEPRG